MPLPKRLGLRSWVRLCNNPRHVKHAEGYLLRVTCPDSGTDPLVVADSLRTSAGNRETHPTL